MDFADYYFDRDYKEVLSEIELIMFLNQLRSQWRKISRKQFMDKYSIFEEVEIEELVEFAKEADIKKFNTHINNLNLASKLKAIESSKQKFLNDPIINEYQLKSLMALKLSRSDLSYTITSTKRINELNKYQKKLTYKINALKNSDIITTSNIKKLINEKIAMNYQESHDIYSYYYEEAMMYPNIVDKVESILQIQEDNGFILFTEFCKFIRKSIDFNSRLPYKKRLSKNEREILFKKLKIELMEVPLPIARIQLIRRMNEYFDISNHKTIDEFIERVLSEINKITKNIIDMIEETESELEVILVESLAVYLLENYLRLKPQYIFNIEGPLRFKDSIYNDMLAVMIEYEYKTISPLIQQTSYIDDDFKSVDVITFDNINKKTEVRIIENI
ncbi:MULTISPECIES: hypothetical protein [Staphylococcaceae]|uniref:Uncharacterized protein n=1 Tax=Macrococcus equipercicus TaxID=69967 RepID=A0A9Q9BNP3_9STAP|nr:MULTISPECIES: hypothetical protein [Macrococcus]MBC9873945.1 hypothetical protein [Macrococcus bohemicus]UTH13845.1 hypothetical protein KFV11_00250 [Macrococcus equipercicus]